MSSPFRIRRHGMIIAPESHPQAGTNINGPSLVRAPDWLDAPAPYLLYFADHKGQFIRLAVADEVTGPYRWHDGGSLHLADSCFPTTVPQGIEPTTDIQRAAIDAEGYDAHFTPHIASPDVVIDHTARRLVMAFHGLEHDGSQLTRIATATDALHFTAEEPLVAFPYLRILPDPLPDLGWLALSMPGIVYRSADLLAWVAGPLLFDASFRHCAVVADAALPWGTADESTVHVFWSRVGDEPEHLLHTPITRRGAWTEWDLGPTSSVLRPEEPWEGANLPVVPSVRGQVVEPVHQLRDPALLVDDDRVWLAYCVAGESGIALAEVLAS